MTLTVKAQDGQYVYVFSTNPLAKGSLILFDESVTGVVYLEPTESEPDLYTVRIYDDTTVSSARVKRWWAPLHPKTQLKVPETFFGDKQDTLSLRVPCRLPEAHRPGLLGWTLYYQNEAGQYEPILSGNDLHMPSFCFYERTGEWKAGSYLLKAASYTSELMPRREASMTWTVEQPTTTLWCPETTPLNLL